MERGMEREDGAGVKEMPDSLRFLIPFTQRNRLKTSKPGRRVGI
jgi:hypothetical protein